MGHRRTIVAFGEAKRLHEWIADPRCGVNSSGAFANRVKRGMTDTEAIETPPRLPRGYSCLVGQSKGRLTVSAVSERRKNGRYFLCHCACGSTVWRHAETLKKVSHSSCGCDRSRVAKGVQMAHARKYASQWQKLNREYRRMYMRKWKRNNKDKTATYAAKRRGACPAVHATIYREAASSSVLVCVYCGALTFGMGDRHVDHIVPVSRGGGHIAGNLAIACSACNLAKHAKTGREFMLSAHAIEDAVLG